MKSRMRASRSTATRSFLSHSLFFFFNDTATTEIYTLSLHDALPISPLAPVPAPADIDAIDHREWGDRKSTRLNSSHVEISYAVFCLKKKKKTVRIPWKPKDIIPIQHKQKPTKDI